MKKESKLDREIRKILRELDSNKETEKTLKMLHSEYSDEPLSWLDAVKYAAQQGGILQSAREAAMRYAYESIAYQRIKYRINLIHKLRSEIEHKKNLVRDTSMDDWYERPVSRGQATRTVAVYFKDGDKFYAAIDDADCPEENILVAKAHKMFKSDCPSGALLGTDTLVKAALLRAEETGRIVKTNSKSMIDTLRPSRHDWCKAVLLDTVVPYTTGVRAIGGDVSREIWSLTPRDLEKRGVDSKYVWVEPISLDWTTINAANSLCQSKSSDLIGLACARYYPRALQTKERIVELADKGLYERIRKNYEIKPVQTVNVYINIGTIEEGLEYQGDISIKHEGYMSVDDILFEYNLSFDKNIKELNEEFLKFNSFTNLYKSAKIEVRDEEENPVNLDDDRLYRFFLQIAVMIASDFCCNPDVSESRKVMSEVLKLGVNNGIWLGSLLHNLDCVKPSTGMGAHMDVNLEFNIDDFLKQYE